MANGNIRVKRDDLIAKLKAARAENQKKMQAAEKKALAESIETAKKEIARWEKFLKNPSASEHYNYYKRDFNGTDQRYESILKMLELSVDDVIEYSVRSNDWYEISSLI